MTHGALEGRQETPSIPMEWVMAMSHYNVEDWSILLVIWRKSGKEVIKNTGKWGN